MDNLKREEFVNTFCADCDFARECEEGRKCAVYETMTRGEKEWADELVMALNKIGKLFKNHPADFNPLIISTDHNGMRVVLSTLDDIPKLASEVGISIVSEDIQQEWFDYCNVEFTHYHGRRFRDELGIED